MGKYKFNREQLKFVEDRKGLRGWIITILKYFIASLLLAVLYYFIISLFFSTKEERRIARENKILSQEYQKLLSKIDLLDNALVNLQVKDREIYKSIFNAEPPTYFKESVSSEYFFDQIDTTDNDRIIEFTKGRLDFLCIEANNISSTISDIRKHLDSLGDNVKAIPSIIPLKDFSIEQTGASIGKKINPFYKTVLNHKGIDLLAANGTDVFATADGYVESIGKVEKGVGRNVVINHINGYTTKYFYLGDILVRKGQAVRQGDVIARVGISGMSFAPHLHYEVLYDGKNVDPVNYFFSNLSPQLLKEMITISLNTGQSLD